MPTARRSTESDVPLRLVSDEYPHNRTAAPALDLATLAAPGGPPVGSPISELRALREPGRLLARRQRLSQAPRGDGRVVVTVPGFGVADWVGMPLRQYLARLGYAPQGWGLGLNRGDPEADAARLALRVAALAREHGPVSLVGWSLGGVVAREVARLVPDDVRSVVMFGSPVVGGPTHTILHGLFSAADKEKVTVRAAQLDRDMPVRVPVTSIYSRRDGVVNWLSCLDRRTPGARHVEVSASHLGLPLDPDVWLAVADAIARD